MLTQEDLMAIAALMEKTIDQKLEPIKGRLDTMDEQLKDLKKENLDTRAIIETQIDHSIKLLAEGHTDMARSIARLSAKLDKLEDIPSQVSVLKKVVAVHSEQIRELQEKIG